MAVKTLSVKHWAHPAANGGDGDFHVEEDEAHGPRCAACNVARMNIPYSVLDPGKKGANRPALQMHRNGRTLGKGKNKEGRAKAN